jgi:hypothetical protein
MGRPEHSLHEVLEPRPLFWNPTLTYLAMFTRKGAFRDYKTVDELLDIEPPEEEMFWLEWNPRVLDDPLYQREFATGYREHAHPGTPTIW